MTKKRVTQDGRPRPPSGALAQLMPYRLLDLTTFKRSGVPVTTPVRFAIDGDRIVLSLQSGSGKVKRLRSNPQAQIGGHKGSVTLNGEVRLLSGKQATDAYAVLKQRHRMLTLQRLLLGRHPTQHVSAEFKLTTTPQTPRHGVQ